MMSGLIDSTDDATQSRSSSMVTVTCEVIRFLVDDDRSANDGTSSDKRKQFIRQNEFGSAIRRDFNVAQIAGMALPRVWRTVIELQ